MAKSKGVLPIYPDPIETNCAGCGKPMTITDSSAKSRFRKVGRAACSMRCVGLIANTPEQRKASGDRMRNNPPMRNPVTLEKMLTKMRVHRSAFAERCEKWRKETGGVSIHSQALANAIGWPMEVAVAPGGKRTKGMPTHYRLDVANKILKVDIEVDGDAHKRPKRRIIDERRDRILIGLGWTILRFTNKEVETDLKGCVQIILSTISQLKGIAPILPTDA